jgi:hypothetical protein
VSSLCVVHEVHIQPFQGMVMNLALTCTSLWGCCLN